MSHQCRLPHSMFWSNFYIYFKCDRQVDKGLSGELTCKSTGIVYSKFEVHVPEQHILFRYSKELYFKFVRDFPAFTHR